MYEERKFTRYLTNIPCEINYLTDSKREKMLLKDVSLEGLAFTSKIKWDIDSAIMIHLLIPPPIELTGLIIRCSSDEQCFNIGVKLIKNKSEDSQHYFKNYQHMLVNIIEDMRRSWD
ncbi:MAG: PilZ domain-containing protein [Thiomargarita sp.]|nr:PilZ domain-containing protein [Thiomargarita sp.]